MFWSNKRKSRNHAVEVSRTISAKEPRHMMNTAKETNRAAGIYPYDTNAKKDNTQSAYMTIQKKEQHIITGCDSCRGRRESQQDCHFVTKSIHLSPFKIRRTFAVVCDGMGGLEAGDRASITAVEIMKLAFKKLPTKKVDIPRFYHDMMENIDYEISHWKDLDSDRGAGTTLVSVLLENRRLYWANVGDSSLFLIQGGRIKRITREHNYGMYLTEMVLDGKITQEQANEDPQRKSLVSYLGMGGVSFMDIPNKPYMMKNGDILMLCTDGVTDALSTEEILDIVTAHSNDLYMCCRCITRAVTDKDRESQDNATVVMLQYVE